MTQIWKPLSRYISCGFPLCRSVLSSLVIYPRTILPNAIVSIVTTHHIYVLRCFLVHQFDGYAPKQFADGFAIGPRAI